MITLQKVLLLPGVEYEVLGDVVAVGIYLVPPVQQLGVVYHDTVQLVAQSDPVWLYVVRSAEEFNLPGAGGQSLNDPVYLVRFVAGSSDYSSKAGLIPNYKVKLIILCTILNPITQLIANINIKVFYVNICYKLRYRVQNRT